MYLSLPYLGSAASFHENKVKDIVGNTHGAVKHKVAHFTKKSLNGIFKDETPVQEKHNVVYHFKCHCDSDCRENVTEMSYTKGPTYHQDFKKLVFRW